MTSSQTRPVWDRIALWWDKQIGEGNDFQKLLIMPTTDRLLDPRPGQTILDIACGNGNYSRRLARAGAKVVACDFSEKFLERARAQTDSPHSQIDYRLLDATDPAQLLSFGQSRFDSAVCGMAMMDMPTISPLLQSLAKLLKPHAPFVFSLPHPCFHSNDMKMTAALEYHHDKAEQTFGVEVRNYLSQTPRPLRRHHQPARAPPLLSSPLLRDLLRMLCRRLHHRRLRGTRLSPVQFLRRQSLLLGQTPPNPSRRHHPNPPSLELIPTNRRLPSAASLNAPLSASPRSRP